MFPQLRDMEDFRHKLWDHLAIMSDFKLDIDYPVEIVKKESLEVKPDRNSLFSERHSFPSLRTVHSGLD